MWLLFCLTYLIFLPFQIPSFCSLQGLLGRVKEEECENVCPSQTLLGQTEHNECKGTNQGWPCHQLLCIGDSGFWRQNKQMCTKPNQYQQSVSDICLVAFVISLDKTPSLKPHKCWDTHVKCKAIFIFIWWFIRMSLNWFNKSIKPTFLGSKCKNDGKNTFPPSICFHMIGVGNMQFYQIWEDWLVLQI